MLTYKNIFRFYRNEPFCFADHKWDHTVQKCICKFIFNSGLLFVFMSSKQVYLLQFLLLFFFSACHQGYFGLNCETKCPFPYYGFKCQLECNCIDKNCHHVSGCITASEGTSLKS